MVTLELQLKLMACSAEMHCKTVCGVVFLLYLFSSCSKTDDALPTCKELVLFLEL